MCPFSSSLPPGDSPSRFSPSAAQEWQPRRKSVSNACERCRRRKIRCDGSTPCATCSRFSLQCVRIQKPKDVLAAGHQQALEVRIHQLEAQLAAHMNTPMHGLDPIDTSLMKGVSTFDWHSPSPLAIATDCSTPYKMSSDIGLESFSVRGPHSIAISEARPSPVPSFCSGTTKASSPDRQPTSAPHLPPNSASSSSRRQFSPPAISNKASWDFIDPTHCLKPHSSIIASGDYSRRASVSSSSTNSGGQASSSLEEHEGDANIQPPGAIPYPSRFETETLTSEFLQYLETLDDPKPYTLSPATYISFCEFVYPSLSEPAPPADTTLSTPMARFHIFLSMAIGMKLPVKDSGAPTNLLLDRCYQLAMKQASTAIFCQETGDAEAAQLLSIFASLGREFDIFQPKPIYACSTW